MTTKQQDLSARMTGSAARRETRPGTQAAQTTAARITLHLPPALMRQVERWALDAAETLMLPRVSTQDAMRAMLRACVSGNQASNAALAQVRQDRD